MQKTTEAAAGSARRAPARLAAAGCRWARDKDTTSLLENTITHSAAKKETRAKKKRGRRQESAGRKLRLARDTLFCSTEDDDGGRRQRSTATMASDDRWLCRREFIRGDRRCRLVVVVSVVDRACAVDTNSMEDGGFRRHRKAN